MYQVAGSKVLMFLITPDTLVLSASLHKTLATPPLHQVGVMLASSARLSQNGVDFANMLKSKKVSAADALSKPYLQ